jgi:uncharacterized integral membrane protein (TIGR00698 family)
MNDSVSSASSARAAAVPALSPNVALAGGVGLCLVIALIAEYVAQFIPLIGAPIIAIAFGVVLTNLAGQARVATPLRIKEVSGYALRGGIILLGATLNLRDVVASGATSLPLLALTITLGLAFPLLVGRAFGVHWRMRCLIGMGTTICGASAIAALAPVLKAKTEEIAYSISVIFFFNMLAVIIFPTLGHWLHLSDDGFGMWSGTAVNDTSAVVAAGFAYSHDAGVYATIVKLTRTTLIIPLVLGFGLAMPWIDPEHAAGPSHLGARIKKAIPWFIALFILTSLINTLGFVPWPGQIQDFARFVLVVALAAVGMQAHWRAFAGAGVGPLMLGLGTWFVVAASSLAVQAWTHMM